MTSNKDAADAADLAALERAWRPPDGWRRLSAVNNTQVGVFYIVTALVFFLLAGVLALLMRAQLAAPGLHVLGPQAYNQVFTMHGTVMMFLFAVPIVEAIAVYLLPPMLGARDLPFPRLSAYAFWAYAGGGLAFFCTLFFGVAPDGGWFMYPPLTSGEHSPGIGADFWLLGIGFIEISAIAGAIELIVGILFTRAPGMTLMKMPVFAWAMLVVALMIVFAFPAVIAGTTLLELERSFDWPFFIADRGGDPLLWQHLFWFFGHPEVYIIFLPAAGLVSMMIPALTGKPLVGYRAVVVALAAVALISFALWAHHMFTAGLGSLAMVLVSAASLAVAVPTSVQVFAWIATLWQGRLRLAGGGWFILGFLFIFVFGGLTGVMVAVLPFDWQVHDTYFIVAHLHYVLIGGVVFPVFAALVHWSPFWNGQQLSERALRWSFWLLFGGFNLAFFPMHVSGLLGMPRRVYTYDAGLGWDGWNLASTAGAFVFAAGVLVFAVCALRGWAKPDRPHGNPWRAGTLEWLPNEEYGTRSIPQVTSREPLWTHPALGREVEAGRHWLPRTVTGLRETIVTSVRNARPTHVLVLPGDGWLPLLAGLGTAAFFMLLTVKLLWLSAAFGVLTLWAVIRWLWDSDRAHGPAQAAVGPAGERLPIGDQGRREARSHAWWATVTLVAVDATIFASFVFAHLHVSMLASVCPPPGSNLPPAASSSGGVAAWLLSALAMVAVLRLRLDGTRRMAWLLSGCTAAALVAAAAGFGLDLAGHATALLDPRANAWSATAAVLIAWQGFHGVLLVLMAGYLVVRAWAGLLTPRQHGTRDAIALFWLVAAVQGALAIAVLPLVAAWMRP